MDQVACPQNVITSHSSSDMTADNTRARLPKPSKNIGDI